MGGGSFCGAALTTSTAPVQIVERGIQKKFNTVWVKLENFSIDKYQKWYQSWHFGNEKEPVTRVNDGKTYKNICEAAYADVLQVTPGAC